MQKILLPLKMLVLLMFLGFSSFAQQEINYNDSWSPAGFSLKNQKTSSVEVWYSIQKFSFSNLNLKGEEMLNIELPGNFLFNDEGMPNLPGSGRYIAVPKGAKAILKIVDMRVETISNVNIAPAPRIPKETEDGLEYKKNVKAYSDNSFYPSNPIKLSQISQIRGVDVVTLGITPFQYNPITKELKVIRDIKVQVEFVGGNGQFGENRLRSRWFDPILEDAILNSASLPAVDYSKFLDNKTTGCEYLIIRPNNPEYAQWADSVKKFRTEQGILTKIVPLNEIPGGNTTTAIENYINNAYNTWEIPPVAILFMADFGTDASNSINSPMWNDNGSPYCISDNIYADINNDKLPDIITARMTANNATHLQTMVTKFINYERNPPTSPAFYDHPITALGWQTERWFQICSEAIGGFWKNSLGKNPVRINAVYQGNPSSDPWSTATNTQTVVNYFGPNGLGYIPATPSALGGWTGGTPQGVVTAINAGSFMLQHRDHGEEVGWGEPAFGNSYIPQLTNTDLTFIMSVNCLTGKFNWSSECFTEKFHRYTKTGGVNSGALGVVAATEVSYSFVNDAFVWGAYDNMWPNFMPSYGTNPPSRDVRPAFGIAAGKHFLAQSSWPYNTDNKEVTYMLFHHHGDAFLDVFYNVPQNLTVNHTPVIFTGMTTFDITADEGAFIALTCNGQILGTATSTGGPVSITIPGTQLPGDDIILTITKQNFYRYSSHIQVIPPSGPYCMVKNFTVNDLNGNNNQQADYGETINFNVSLKNVGIVTAQGVNAILRINDQYITLIDSTASYPTIDTNQISLLNDAFSLTIANNIPDQYRVSGSVIITDNASHTWTSPFSFVVNAPELAVGDLFINDATGNNDGILDAGETAELRIKTINTGHATINQIEGMLVSGNAYLTVNTASVSVPTISALDTIEVVFSVTADATTPIGTPVTVSYSAGNAQYSTQADKTVVIGLIPEFNMSNTTVNTNVGKFYDSGGANGQYGSNENFVMTFNPATATGKLRFTFNTFETESGYDKLFIYDGNSENAPQIAGSPFMGTTSPGTITASQTNTSGAITFKFTSDNSVTEVGWYADISCIIPLAVGTATAPSAPICSGTSATLRLVGSSGNIQWQQSTEQNGTFTDIQGANSAQYVTEPLTSTMYYRAAVSLGANTLLSNVVSVSTKPSPTAGNSTIAYTEACAGVTDSLKVENYSTGATIQWQKSSSSTGNFENINGATENIYVAENISQTTYFRAKISQNDCDAYSDTLNVEIKPQPVAGILSAQDTLFCAGFSTSGKIENFVGDIQWQIKENDSPDFVNIANADSNYLEINNLEKTANYRVISSQTGTSCVEQISNVVKINVKPQPNGGIPVSETYTACKGNAISMELTETAGNIQWQKATSPTGIFTSISGANMSIYTTSLLTVNTYYRAILSDNAKGCVKDTSALIEVTVNIPAALGKATVNKPILCEAGEIILTAASAKGNIQWQESTNPDSNFTDISGATDDTLTIPNVTGNVYYKVIASQEGIGCNDVVSNVLSVKLNNTPVLDEIAGQTIDKGQTFANINLNDFVSDDITADSKLIWNVTSTKNITVIIQNQVTRFYVTNPQWNGIDTLHFTVKDGCNATAQDTAIFTVKIPAAINAISTSQVIISPNPSKGIFNIKTNNVENGNLMVKVLSLDGKTIHSQKLEGSSTNVFLENAAKGIYQVIILLNNKIISTEKLIVE